MSLFLGIDTSNYTTSVSLLQEGTIVENIKLPVYVKPGERGARQSDAVFSHVKNLPVIFKNLSAFQPDAIGVSCRPRDVEGSYMPCFLSGVAVATALSQTLGIPLYTFSHQAGHVRAALYSARRLDLSDKELIAFHVSGGTTEVLHYQNSLISCIGGTKDINAGQLIDRIGVLLGLTFPCGKELEALCDFNAMKAENLRPMTHTDGLFANLSGLENKAESYLRQNISHGAIAAFVMASIEKTLSSLVLAAKKEYGDLPILFSGGVSSNRFLKNTLSQKFSALFAEPIYSADNAAGIALLCQERFEQDECHKTN